MTWTWPECGPDDWHRWAGPVPWGPCTCGAMTIDESTPVTFEMDGAVLGPAAVQASFAPGMEGVGWFPTEDEVAALLVDKGSDKGSEPRE